MPYIFVGLGNPGEEYENTRHNVGRIMLDFFATAHELPDWSPKKNLQALVSEGKVGKEKVMLIEPETFMNKSGKSVAPVVKSVKAAEKLVVIHDDLDLPLGKIRMSFNRGAGGHRGVESIMKAIHTEAFVRIKVGIAPEAKSGIAKKPKGEEAVNKFILGKLKPDEMAEFKKMAKKVSGALEILLKDGRDVATMFANSL